MRAMVDPGQLVSKALTNEGQLGSLPHNCPDSHIAHRQAVDAWVRYLDESARLGLHSPETTRTYQSGVRRWLAWLDARGHQPPTPTIIQEFISAMRQEASPVLANRLLHTLRSLYRWTETQGRYPAIARSVKGFRVSRDGPLPAPERSEIELMLTSLMKPLTGKRRLSEREAQWVEAVRLRNEAFFRMLYNTGLRLVSMQRMNIDDVHLEADPPFVRYAGKGLNSADSVVFLAEGTQLALGKYLHVRKQMMDADASALWIGYDSRPGRRMSVRSMRAIINRSADSAGFTLRDSDGRMLDRGRWSPHAIRRSAATAAVEHGGLEAGQFLMGHRSAETTKNNYVRVVQWRRLAAIRTHLDLPSPRSH